MSLGLLLVLLYLVVWVATMAVLIVFGVRDCPAARKGGSAPPPPPTPPTCAVPPDRVGDPLKGVYAPQRLQVFSECQVAEGVVEDVRHELDGDTHIRLKPDPNFMFLAKAGQDFIIAEIIPPDQASVKEPQVGQQIHVEGPWALDRIHLWNEIHPVFRLTVIS